MIDKVVSLRANQDEPENPLKLVTHTPSFCRHESVSIDNHARSIVCTKCGANLDPFDFLAKQAEILEVEVDMAATLFFDPVKTMISVFSKMAPEANVEIIIGAQLSDAESKAGILGVTIFQINEPHMILISQDVSLGSVADILAHEFAHVIAGEHADHDKLWEDAYAALHAGYLGACDEIMAQGGAQLLSA